MFVFRPITSVTVATSTTSANAALPTTATHARFYNASTTAAWVEFSSTASPTAAIPANGTVKAGVLLAPGATESFAVPVGAAYFGVILPAGASASTLTVCSGEGF